MVHRGTTREPKRFRVSRSSSLSDKMRRHRNKRRIWKRCIERLALLKEAGAR